MSEEPKQRRQGQFVPNDPRINRGGRPKTLPALRKLAQQIAHEQAKANGEPIVLDGHLVTVIEAIVRQWASSKNPRLQMAFVELAYGKLVQEVSGEGGGPIAIEVIYTDKAASSDSQAA